MRQWVGQQLRERGRLRKGDLALLSDVLGVPVRTLRCWRERAAEAPAVMGRPPHTEDERRAALPLVLSAWESQGKSSGRGRVLKALQRMGRKVSESLVREHLRDIKAAHQRVLARRREAERVHVTVHARDALWSQDASHMARAEEGKVEALAVKDVAAVKVVGTSVGGPTRGMDVRALLERIELERGTLPFVLGMDRGPANRDRELLAWLRKRSVIVLFNVPRTPQHNAPIESFWSELKLELDALGELQMPIADASQGPRSLSEAGVQTKTGHFRVCVPRLVARLNTQRVRPSRGGYTADELDRILPHAEDLVDRACFYDTACAAIERAVQGITNARARQRAEREAIWRTLEEFGLVTRTRGRRPTVALKAA
jgi:transposase InsO family protein